MANSRGGRFPRSSARSPRRKTSWTFGPQTGVDGATQPISTSIAQLATGFVTVEEDGLTLARTRGELIVLLGLSDAVGNGFHGAFGIAVATSAAVVAGAASLPSPITEETWDGWLYHRYFGIFSGGAVAVATAAQQTDQVNATCGALRLEVDSKAMRKVDVDQSLYAMIEVIELGNATMEWAFNSRMLIMLP